MKIIHTIPSIDQEASGPTYSVTRLCESELALGVGVDLAALENVRAVKALPFLRTFPYGIGPRRLGRSPSMFNWIEAESFGGRVDLLHNHSLWMMPNIYPSSISHASGVPLILSPRGTLSVRAMKSGSLAKSIFWPMVQRPALEKVSCFHATAFSEYLDIRRRGFRQPVCVIPNGIDIPVLTTREKANAGRTLLFLGRIHPIKGLDMLLTAWKVLQDVHPDWRLKVVGPDHRGQLRSLLATVERLGLQRVDFCGAIYGPDKIHAYGSSDLFVLPTYSENFGVSVAEALSCGIPAVVTKGAPWVGLEKYEAGWWVDVNVDALIAGLHTAMNKSRPELSRMGANGRAWMASEYSWPEIARRMIHTYKWIVSGGPKPDWVLVD